jgi:hypothetical protein
MQRKGGDSISARRITQTKRIDRSSDRGTGIGCSRGQGEGKIRRNNWKAMRSTDSLQRGEEGIDPRPSVDEISPPRQHENDVGDAARGGRERKEKTRGGRRGIVEGHAWISRCGVGSGFQEIGCRARVGLWSLDTIGSGLNRLVVPPNKKEINSTTLAS